MKIDKIKVKNFRALCNVSICCESLTAFLGRNGSGKSCILWALDTFYNVSAPISKEDFFDRDMNVPIEITLEFNKLSSDEVREFQTYIQDDKFIVTKRIELEAEKIVQRYYGTELQIPEFAKIRKMLSRADKRKAFKELVDSKQLKGLEGTAKSADEVDRMLLEYEQSHQDKRKPIERETQFMGPRNIGGGILDKYTKFVLIPAVKEASDEVLGNKSAIYQLLDTIVIRQINSRKDIREFKEKFQTEVKELYSTENLSEIKDLGVSISKTLKKFSPGSDLKLSWGEMRPPEIQLPQAVATLIEDNFEGDISRKGHGLQRALVLTLLQHLAMLETQSVNSDSSEVKTSVPDLILAIEEPELYLHPSRCRYLSQVLLHLTTTATGGLSTQNQIFYTTHSPYFVDLERFNQIRKVRKIPVDGTATLQCSVNGFTDQNAVDELERICKVEPGAYSTKSFRTRSTSVMNTIVNEGYFADVVMVVEGQTELGVFSKLQELLNKNWEENSIVIVPADGKNNIDRPVIIFRGLSIPTFFLFDGDGQNRGKGSEEQCKKKNQQFLRLAGVNEQDFPMTKVKSDWAVFEKKIEHTIKSEIGDSLFTEIEKKVADELGITEKDKVLKNVNGAARFIEETYSQGKKVETLELIVNNVSNLALIK